MLYLTERQRQELTLALSEGAEESTNKVVEFLDDIAWVAAEAGASELSARLRNLSREFC
jgi:hypothetical protein